MLARWAHEKHTPQQDTHLPHNPEPPSPIQGGRYTSTQCRTLAAPTPIHRWKKEHIYPNTKMICRTQKFSHTPRKKTSTREQNFISKFGNNISSLGNNISNLGNNISRLETTFSSRKKRFYQAYKAVFHRLYPIFYTRTMRLFIAECSNKKGNTATPKPQESV